MSTVRSSSQINDDLDFLLQQMQLYQGYLANFATRAEINAIKVIEQNYFNDFATRIGRLENILTVLQNGSK